MTGDTVLRIIAGVLAFAFGVIGGILFDVGNVPGGVFLVLGALYFIYVCSTTRPEEPE